MRNLKIDQHRPAQDSSGKCCSPGLEIAVGVETFSACTSAWLVGPTTLLVSLALSRVAASSMAILSPSASQSSCMTASPTMIVKHADIFNLFWLVWLD